mgnify:CR=1 FL=1
MNNRQFLITAMLFLLILTGYNQFVALPRARAAKEAAEAQLKKQEQTAQQPSAQSVLAATTLVTKPQPEELFTLNMPQADVTFSSKGAGIKTYLFKDVVEDVNLTPYEGEGYFATMPQVDFAEFARTKDSITFVGDIVRHQQRVRYV